MSIRKTPSILLFMILCLALSGVVPAAAQGPGKNAALEITVSAPGYDIVTREDGVVSLELDGFQVARIPGYPAMPVRMVDVGLPPGARAVGITILETDTEDLGSGWELERVPAQTTGEGKLVQLELGEPFPGAPVELEGTHAFGGAAFARLRFYPFRYDPTTGSLSFTSRARVEVRYQSGTGPNLPVRSEDLDMLSLSNADQAKEWYDGELHVQSAEGYLILTTDTLAASSAVQNFMALKRATVGYNVYVATPSDWSGFPGNDEADKIRNFLTDRYGPWNLRWLLIIGSKSTIPMKVVYPSSTDHANGWPTPTDAYYADLTGDWDADGDGYPGEWSEDAADFAAELRVGRIPFDDEATIAAILQKTTTYATEDGQWRRKALLAMAVMDYTGTGEIRTDGAALGAEMKSQFLDAEGFASYRLYEEGPPSSVLPHEAPLTMDSTTSTWDDGYGFVAWWAHGSRYGAYRRLPSGYTPFITYDNTPVLNDSKPSIVFQTSCLNAQPEYTNLGAELLKQGAVAVVGGTRDTWYYLYWDEYTDGGNATMAFLFGQNLVSDRDAAGTAFAEARATYAADHLWFNGDQQNLVSFNLLGDPSIGLSPAGSSMEVVRLEQDLSEGWNLLSFSNLYFRIPVEDAFASIEGSYTKVYTYEPDAGEDPWLRYVPGADPETNTLTHVDGRHGYWVHVTDACTLVLDGTPPAMPVISLYEGWNLVSFPRMYPQDIAESLSAIIDKVVLVYTADEGIGGWRRYNPSSPPWANKLTTFYPGEGYWIKVSEDVVWEP